MVLQTLCGDFVENGNNHSRPTYQKSAVDAGKPPPEVFLYYWDERDGPSFEGWWFGKSVGGNEVWSHNASKALRPPAAGWKIPFSGAVTTTFHVKSQQEQQAAQAKAAAGEKLEKLKAETDTTLAEAMAALGQAKEIFGNGAILPPADSLKQVEELLTKHGQALQVAVKGGEPLQTTAGPALPELRQILTKLRTAMMEVNKELQKVRLAKPKVMAAEKNKEAMAVEKAQLEEALLDAVEKVNLVEDLVEKTAITYSSVEVNCDDPGEAERCVEETRDLGAQSQVKIKEALALIGRKMVSMKSFTNEQVKEIAKKELDDLRTKIRTANQKLTPLLNVRQDYQQMASSKKIVEEVNNRLAPAELDVDRAAEAAEPLTSHTGHVPPSQAIMKQAETAINLANEKLQAALNFLQAKTNNAQGLIKRELEKVATRSQAAEKRLTELKNAHRSFLEREQSTTLMNDVSEKMRAVNEATAKCQEVLAPYLMGVEALGADETQASMQASDEAMKVANKATSAARIVISMKLVEVKRWTAEVGAEAQRALQEHQKELETAMLKLNELKSAIAERKQVMQRAEAQLKVEAIEELAKQVSENGAIINDEEKLKEMTGEQIREAGYLQQSGYQQAQPQIADTEHILRSRQIDAKSLNDEEQGAELARLVQRLKDAKATIAPFKALPANVEKQVALKRMIDEAIGKVAAAEEKVDQAILQIDAIGQEGEEASAPGKKPGDAAKAAADAATIALRGVARYLDIHAKQKKLPEEDITKLQERAKAATERLESSQSAMQESADRAISKGLLQEVEVSVAFAEEAVFMVVEATGPLLADGEAKETDDDKLKELNSAVKAAEQVANKALTASRTLINVKKVAAKRLCASISAATLAELEALQGRIDAATNKKDEPKRKVADKKYEKAKEEVEMQWARLEESVNGAIALGDAFAAAGDEVTDEAVDKTLKSQQDAAAAMSEMKTVLQEHLKTMKAGESTVYTQFTALVAKIASFQVDLDKHKKSLNEREARQVKAKLLQEAEAKFTELNGKLEKMQVSANPLVGDDKEDFTGAMYLSKVVEALKAGCHSVSMTTEQLFDEMRGEDEFMSEAKFVAFTGDLEELKKQEGAAFGVAQIKQAYGRIDVVGGGQVAKRQFVEQFRSRYACTVVVAMTDIAAIEGSKVLRKLEQYEEVDGLEEPAKDEKTGIMRVKVRAVKDQAEGYVALASNAGTVYLEPYSAYEACLRNIEKSMVETAEAIEQTMAYLKEKSDELSKKGNLGPLGEAKAELMKLRMRASKAQSTQTALKKKVADAQKGHAEKLEAERRRKAEAAEKAQADVMVEEATSLTDSTVAEAEKCIAAAESLAAAEVKHGDGNPLEAMAGAARSLALAEQGVAKALNKIMQENMGEIRKVEKGPFVEARRVMFKFKAKLEPLEKKCKKAAATLQGAQAKVSEKAEHAISATLRASLQVEGAPSTDMLFERLSQGEPHITQQALRGYLERLEGEQKLQASQLDLGLHRYASGVTRLGLLAMLQEYSRCVKDGALTSAFEVKSSSTIRKLEKGELLEILGARGKDEAVGLERCRCRALKDRAEGYVTTKGNQGTAFVEAAEKPYFFINEVKEQCRLQQECKTGSATVCELQAGEVLELLQGPCKEPPIEIVRVRGKAKKDGKLGWTTLQDPVHSTPNLELTKLMVCKASIALTTSYDVKECTSIRKVDVGEMLEVLEEAKEDATAGVTRVHVKAMKDGKDGWATMKGNAGTIFIAESPRDYICRRAVPLEGAFASGSKAIRNIEEGEIFEVLEGPSTETKQGSMRTRGRSVRSGSEGWLTTGAHIVRWSPQHTCIKPIALREAAAASAATIRMLEQGEILQALDAPAEVAGTEGKLQLHVRTEKDNVLGFADVRAGPKSDVYLKSAAEGSSA